MMMHRTDSWLEHIISNATKAFISPPQSVLVDAFNARRRRQEGGRQSAGDSGGQGGEGAAGGM